MSMITRLALLIWIAIIGWWYVKNHYPDAPIFQGPVCNEYNKNEPVCRPDPLHDDAAGAQLEERSGGR